MRTDVVLQSSRLGEGVLQRHRQTAGNVRCWLKRSGHTGRNLHEREAFRVPRYAYDLERVCLPVRFDVTIQLDQSGPSACVSRREEEAEQAARGNE